MHKYFSIQYISFDHFDTIELVSMVSKNDDSPSDGDDKWLTCVKREPYLLHVKDTLVHFK